MSLNSSISVGEKKKKKFVKAQKLNQSLSMRTDFESQTLKFDLDVSEIHSLSKAASQQASSLDIKMLQKQQSCSETLDFTNLHHNENFVDCLPQFQQKQLLKSIKKYVKKAFNGANNIEVFYGKKVPTLKFQYNDTKRNGQRKVRDLKELMKSNKELGEKEYQVIQKIFDQLYHRINSSQLKIQKFLKLMTQKKKIELDFSNFTKTPLLYYQYQEKRINFTFFDRDMRMFEFNSDVTQEMKFDTSELKHWQSFLDNLHQRRQKNQKHFDEFGQHQVSSDEECGRYEDTASIEEVQSKIRTLLEADLASYEQQMEQLECRCNQMMSRNDDKQKDLLQKEAEQLSQLHTNLDNFKEAINLVKEQLGRARRDVHKLRNLLKILIIAEKQLKSKLPIIARKQEIFKRLNKSDLIILEGETGSGKSTQLPQMLCQYLRVFQNDSREKLPILITQPRRLATRTVAERVAFEMQEKIGGFVDYATSSYKPVSRTAKILFKLDSVVLDQLTSDRCLSKYSCLIIDEAHQRTISIDVILGLVKQLQEVRKGFKVIVTSASLDAKLFEDYFHSKIMKVSGRLYPVQVLYRPIVHQPDLIKKVEMVIKKDILLNSSEIKKQYKGDILVFCSGVDDINILCNIFQRYLNPKIFRVFALHGKIAVGEQKEVFLQTKQLKLIFASRIAQTSITINGVKVVIDPGVDRELVYDQKFRVSSRKLVNISQSSAKQRAGRAGRTSHGFCFRLYSQAQLSKFRINKTPEIDNIALDTLVLRLKSLNVDNIFTFKYIKAPDKQALKMSVQTLQMIGGLSEKQQITTIGKLLLQLHIEPFLGRSIVQAIVLDYIVRNTKYLESEHEQTFSKWQKQDFNLLWSLKPIVIQILCMVINSSNLFYSSLNTRQKLQEIKYTNFSSQKGDFFYLSNIYSQFYHLQKQSKDRLNSWIHSHYLNKKTLFQTKELIEEIGEIIKNFKFDIKDPAIVYLIDTIKLKLKCCKNLDDAILSCMITSFCVNLCLYSQNPRVGYTHVLQKKPVTIYGTSTLALQGLYPKWIVCYDLKDSKQQKNPKDKRVGKDQVNPNRGVTYCQIAHQIQFDFLKHTVQDYVFKKLNLKQAQKMNPFYEKIDKVLPTCILKEIESQYMNSQNNNHPILKYITYDVSQQTNRISIFYSKNLKATDIYADKGFQPEISIHDLVTDYVQLKKIKKKNEKLIYNIISNIFVQFDDGFLVKSLNFTDAEIEFLVKGERVILNQIRQILQGINAYPFGNILKVIVFNREQQHRVRDLLTQYALQFDEQKRQKKQQNMTVKIYMHFYTGKLNKDPLFLYYGKKNNIPHQMLDILQEFQLKYKNQAKNKSKYAKIICGCRFSISLKFTGIKCFNSSIDAFEVKQALENLIINGMLPFDFRQPLNIQEFREIQSHAVASRSEKEWETEITKVLTANKLSGLTVAVKNQKQQPEEPRTQNIEKYIKHELTATITSNSLQTIDQMVKKLDGKEGIIGAGKIHFRYNFKQLIVKVNKRAFDALKDQFEYQKQIFESTTNVRIETYTKQFGKVSHTFITCRSPIRQNLLKPTEVIANLFTPFIKRLEISHFNFLYNTDQGQAELQRIEQNLEYRVLFGFVKKIHCLRVYCLDYQYEQIQKRIDAIFEDHHIFVQSMSYKTKGLVKVQEMLNQIIEQNQAILKKDRNSKLNLNYYIVYKRREVQISGDFISINKARKEWQKIGNSLPGSCNLCNKDVEKPFKLMNCLHEFCWKCLGDYVDQTKRDEDGESKISGIAKVAPLTCPQDGCGVNLNPNDLQVLLSTEEFEALSYKRVRQYVKAHKEYFFCPTSKCEQIFQVKTVNQKPHFQCSICGHWFCSICRQPHQHFDCKQWSSKLVRNELLSFGFKKCSCGYIIQKEQKGKQIRCKQCDEYLCWSCSKTWKNEKACSDHIKICKN